jgi:hypothetical protein
MGSVQGPRRARGRPEEIDPPHRAVEGDRDAGVDGTLGLRPVDNTQFQSDSPFRGFLTFEWGRVDEEHVSDDYAQGFESKRGKHISESTYEPNLASAIRRSAPGTP